MAATTDDSFFRTRGLIASDFRFGTSKLKHLVHNLIVFNSDKKASTLTRHHIPSCSLSLHHTMHSHCSYSCKTHVHAHPFPHFSIPHTHHLKSPSTGSSLFSFYYWCALLITLHSTIPVINTPHSLLPSSISICQQPIPILSNIYTNICPSSTYPYFTLHTPLIRNAWKFQLLVLM